MKEDELIEKLADLCHQQWSGWMKYLFEKCSKNSEGHVEIPRWAVERWIRQLYTHYEDLPDEEKESDRIEARKFIKLLKKQGVLRNED